jgi:hypothetical protein
LAHTRTPLTPPPYRLPQLRGLCEQIHALWSQLKVPEVERKAFFEANRGASVAVVEACEDELDRLRGMRAEMLKPLILELREEITGMWDKMGTDTSERDAFLPITVDDESFSEELLQEHEAHVTQLAAQYEVLEPIFKLIERRERLLEEKEKHAISLADPTRLTARGREASKRLQEEQKREKRIKTLPKLQEALVTKIKQWQGENKRNFMFQVRWNYVETAVGGWVWVGCQAVTGGRTRSDRSVGKTGKTVGVNSFVVCVCVRVCAVCCEM